MPRLDAPCPSNQPDLRSWRPDGSGANRLALTTLLILLIAALALPGAHAASKPELHVLIDVSGSMKKTDPENLRKPALRLLGDLVPEQSRVQVDLFGNRITTVLPASEATGETKRGMREAAGRIRSNEPFTDIPAALEAANRVWGEETQRNIILLSDGKVDISPDEAVNERATARLREQVIPTLIDKDVQVHTVALSEAADAAILTEIAERTGGLALSARSNADLQRVFLSLFEATAPRTGVPLVENRFRVDDSISELTLVVFREDGAEPTRIKLPDGGEVDATLAARLEDWRWDDSAGRDLITITDPPAGSWQILAAEDPDNRALVITDLKLGMPDLPSRIYPGETIDGQLLLTNHGEPIVEPRLTDDINASVQVSDPVGNSVDELALNDVGADPDVLGGDGVYHFRIHITDDPGIYTLEGRASGPTFERVIRKKVALARTQPFEARVEIEAATDNGEGTQATPAQRRLVVEQDVSVLAPAASRIEARILCSASGPTAIEASLAAATNRIDLPAGTIRQDCQLSGKITGRTRDGRDITLPLALEVPGVEPVEAAKDKTESPEPAAGDEAHQKQGNPWIAALIGLAGLALLALIGWLWHAANKRKKQRLIRAARA
ncbi:MULTISPECIES: VWA domain-containing protein [unclassified Guyparkeria]|uniref:VWA domain-containing protein n=1 Tax=unclassified Guyparkeria TaxID=2626246 RepID=UPI0012E3317F|nr:MULTISPECIES: VWA domain-containing protein [unclassified Guyparkeria]